MGPDGWEVAQRDGGVRIHQLDDGDLTAPQ